MIAITLHALLSLSHTRLNHELQFWSFFRSFHSLLWHCFQLFVVHFPLYNVCFLGYARVREAIGCFNIVF